LRSWPITSVTGATPALVTEPSAYEKPSTGQSVLMARGMSESSDPSSAPVDAARERSTVSSPMA
jgi:hypothetical protein